MADALERVKTALGITGDYLNPTIEIYIEEVKSFMEDAGVSREVIEADMSVGIIARGVSDLWNYSQGGGKLSEYFYQRVAQLRYKKTGGNT